MVFGWIKYSRQFRLYFLFAFSIFLLTSCGPSEIEFAVKHLRDQPGEKITEVLSSATNPGFDNSKSDKPLTVQIQLERNFRNQIIEQLTTNQVSSQRVREKIVELYKLDPMDPEGSTQKALCPLSIVIPAGSQATVTVEWTERWAEGVIKEGTEGQGNQLGAYKVFMGYSEPCSLIKQDNTK